MTSKKTGPREYKEIDVLGAVLIRPQIYKSKPAGELAEPVDFTELGYFLGYRFDPRSMYTIWSPKGVVRGGHLEGRSKLVTVVKGSAFYVLVDMRPGDGQGVAHTFYLGEDSRAWGRSILVPEGVVDAFTATSDDFVYLSFGDRPYNAFDSTKTLDVFDPELKIDWPARTLALHNEEEKSILSRSKFIESLK